jgi:hypothetical protein
MGKSLCKTGSFQQIPKLEGKRKILARKAELTRDIWRR